MFPVVEVQQTFYQPPRVSTLQRWRAAAPDQFEFTLKAWQLITHWPYSPTYRRVTSNLSDYELQECGGFQGTDIDQEAWVTTRACAEANVAMLENGLAFQEVVQGKAITPVA